MAEETRSLSAHAMGCKSWCGSMGHVRRFPSMSQSAPPRPWIIAHRGASAWLPEHTLAAYTRAIADGADAIEPDLVMTGDGVLVARHGNELSASTDVAARAEFAGRRTRRQVDGEWLAGWFVEDFRWDELQRLRAREPLPGLRSTDHDGRYGIPSLDEILELLTREVAARGRPIGLVPELKHPTHFAARGLTMLPALQAALARHPVTREVPVWVQCFEPGTLQALRRELPDRPEIRRLQLIGAPTARPFDRALAGEGGDYAQLLTPAGLREVAGHAEGIGVHKALLMPGGDPSPGRVQVDAAHAAALQVFAYTFRPENPFLGPFSTGEPAARNEAASLEELRCAIATGADALFLDDPGLAARLALSS